MTLLTASVCPFL